MAQREATLRNTPDLAPPRKILPSRIPEELPFPPLMSSHNCRMFSCFDHSRCSLTSGFPVYLYDPDHYTVVRNSFDVDGFLKTTLKQTLSYNAHLTRDPKEACIFVVLVGEALPNQPESDW